MARIEPHLSSSRSFLNWLRAAVLGANDGIISLSGLVIGVAGATDSRITILTAGIAGIIAGAFSMAAGEFVSVSTQRDSERAQLALETYELQHYPDEELQELADLYESKGIKKHTAKIVAQELTDHDALAAHSEIELGIDPTDLTNPWQAALASAVAFVVGAVIPVMAIVLLPTEQRIAGTFTAVVAALVITGVVSARATNTSILRASVRVVLGGVLAMVVAYGVGSLFRVNVG